KPEAMTMSAPVAIEPRNRVEARGQIGAASIAYTSLAVAALSQWQTLRSLEAYWRTVHDYQHGYLIAAVVLAWLYTRRRALDGSAVRPSWFATALLAAAAFLWIIAVDVASQIGQQLLLPPVLILAVWAGAGGAAARVLLGPLAYLYFAIPVWDFLVPGLQQ